jgi:hypothetical protein
MVRHKPPIPQTDFAPGRNVITSTWATAICVAHNEVEMSEGRPMRYLSYLRIRAAEKLPSAFAAAANGNLRPRLSTRARQLSRDEGRRLGN